MTVSAKIPDAVMDPPKPPGLRERSKLEKRRRIKEAAREVFIEKGYEAATTREIAALADVAIGTLFVYAKDKRDLLMLIINDDLDAINDTVMKSVAKKGSLLDQLTEFFRKRYAYWAKELRLARPALQETFDFIAPRSEMGAETARFYARRPKIVALLTEIIKAKQDAGKIAKNDSPEAIANLMMTIYLTENRRWLNEEKPTVEPGIARLRSLLSLAMRGIGPAPEEVGEPE
ncbi:TetR/AcrR family transcriptional regulator [Noviherbaspirillum humi]|nr:TetR/AcrR family transcriptional regulator [Noviherbaspirillum humi]